MRAEEFVDATVFLGMHSTDEDTRAACGTFFAERLDGRLWMSLEQVGRCDDIVWGFSRAEQDAYYPFMDHLHTDLRFNRLPYTESDLAAAASEPPLDVSDRLQLSMAANRGGVLVTLNPRLLSVPGAPVRKPAPKPADGRVVFPAPLEKLYQRSLKLRIDLACL